MRRHAWVAAALCAFAATVPAAALSESARIARDAYFTMEASPFDERAMRQAAEAVSREYQRSPREPWVLIAASRLMLNAGYMSGDRAALTSYRADAVRSALDLAKGAVANGDGMSMAHASLARVLIIAENAAAAAAELDRAEALDSGSFYPPYYRALLAIKQGNAGATERHLKEAERRAALPHHKGWVIEKLIAIAQLQNHVAEQEKYHKQLIELYPGEAVKYGNYALFLKSQKRYDEAIVYYRKAIAIRPYPLAIEQLKQAELLRDAR